MTADPWENEELSSSVMNGSMGHEMRHAVYLSTLRFVMATFCYVCNAINAAVIQGGFGSPFKDAAAVPCWLDFYLVW